MEEKQYAPYTRVRVPLLLQWSWFLKVDMLFVVVVVVVIVVLFCLSCFVQVVLLYSYTHISYFVYVRMRLIMAAVCES